MNVSKARVKPHKRRERASRNEDGGEQSIPTLDSFLEKRDYEGAICLINFLAASEQMKSRVRFSFMRPRPTSRIDLVPLF